MGLTYGSVHEEHRCRLCRQLKPPPACDVWQARWASFQSHFLRGAGFSTYAPRLCDNTRKLGEARVRISRYPPPALLYAINATRSVDWFLKTGEQAAQCLRTALCDINRPIESFESVLDFGCGCGRVLRHWIHTEGPTFRGTDHNPKLVGWAKENLPFEIKQNRLEPPLAYNEGSFDLCYAISVFTHLPEQLQEAWLKELHRILRPNGILFVTLSGEGDLVRTTPSEQEAFYNDGIVVLDGGYAGTNMCGVYHSEAYVRKHWSRYFEVVRFIPEGAKGSPRQDLYVLRR